LQDGIVKNVAASVAASTGKRNVQPAALLQLPSEVLNSIVLLLPANVQLRLAHVATHFRKLLGAGDNDSSFWGHIAATCWQQSESPRSEGASWYAFHIGQISTVTQNCRMLCSQEIKSALNVHYVCSNRGEGGGAKRVPRFERCDANTGYPAVYHTKKPLSVCLLIDSLGAIQGFGIFVTIRFYVGEGAETTRDVRNYLVVKRGQQLQTANGPRRTSAKQVDTRTKFRFRICGEHSDIVRDLGTGSLSTAVVSKNAVVDLNPLRHSVGHCLTAITHEGLSALQVTTLAATRRAIVGRLKRNNLLMF
jgi:hypothetical protein